MTALISVTPDQQQTQGMHTETTLIRQPGSSTITFEEYHNCYSIHVCVIVAVQSRLMNNTYLLSRQVT